jgi:cytochrome c oxidase assembly protein subunit 11
VSGRRAHLGTAALLCGVILCMVGLTAASVPLYRLFCQVTGYGGTTQVAGDTLPEATDRTIKVRFDAGIGDDLPWGFQPVEREIEVRIGEQNLAFYRAENRSDRPVVGQATYNVTPLKGGLYFYKIACFCFDEQTLAAGQSVDMPVSFYVDPAILDDPNTRELKTITLSYTFFMLDEPSKALVDAPSAGGPAS